MKRVRIGAGAGFSDDRIDPAVVLAEHGDLDYLVFECLAERTIALRALDRARDPAQGFDPWLEQRLLAVLRPCRERGTTIITNMGAANPEAAGRLVAQVASRLGLSGLRIAVVTGDDLLGQPLAGELAHADQTVVAVNAYLGSEGILEALARGADVVITGRVADPSLFIAPLMHEFGWALNDWHRLGVAASVGHLLECAGQVSGGYFADPGVKDVAGLADLGFPIAEVSADASYFVTKVPGTGGLVSPATCAEQILYEVHDPSAYLTPDVVADFSGIEFQQLEADVVAASGATGRARPAELKVSIGCLAGFVGEGQISYAGATALARGRLALEIVRERLSRLLPEMSESRYELIGVDSMGSSTENAGESPEVRVRVVGRVATAEQARLIGREVVSLWLNGPAGGAGATQTFHAQVAIDSAYVAREQVPVQVDLIEVP